MSHAFTSGDSRKTLSNDSQPVTLPREADTDAAIRHVHITILGTGFAGLGMAI